MARLSKQTAKSRQKNILRYVVSTDVERTANDLGVSTKQVRAFIRAKPETIQKNPNRYRKFLTTDVRETAKENDVRLVQKLSGKRLYEAQKNKQPSERLERALRYSRATRERYQTTEQGRTVYRPARATVIEVNREQILNNMSGLNQRRIQDLHASGQLSRGEARKLMRQLYKNSGVNPSRANDKV